MSIGGNDPFKREWIEELGMFVPEDQEVTLNMILESETIPHREKMEALSWIYDYIDLAPESVTAVEAALTIFNSKNISESTEIYDSFDVAESRAVHESFFILDSAAIKNSMKIISSDTVRGSRFVKDSDGIFDSRYVFASSEVSNSQLVFNSKFVNDCIGAINSSFIKNSIFAFNCTAAQNAILCTGLKNTSPDTYYFLNNKVDQETFERIYESLRAALSTCLDDKEFPWSEFKKETKNIDNFYYKMVSHFSLPEVIHATLKKRLDHITAVVLLVHGPDIDRE